MVLHTQSDFVGTVELAVRMVRWDLDELVYRTDNIHSEVQPDKDIHLASKMERLLDVYLDQTRYMYLRGS